MKKIRRVCVALLLSLMFVLAGCKPSQSEVLNYLKSNGEFRENAAEKNKYTVEFSVEDDLTYSLKISDTDYAALKDYSATGTLSYLGSYEKSGSYESWGFTNNYKIYYYVIKLDGATVRLNLMGEEWEYDFYLVMHTFSDRTDFSDLNIVRHVSSDSVEASNIGASGYRIGCKKE